MNFVIIHRAVCDLCGRFAPGMFDSKEAAKEEAIRIGWLEDLPQNGHTMKKDDPSSCETCNLWCVFWSTQECRKVGVVCTECRSKG